MSRAGASGDATALNRRMRAEAGCELTGLIGPISVSQSVSQSVGPTYEPISLCFKLGAVVAC